MLWAACAGALALSACAEAEPKGFRECPMDDPLTSAYVLPWEPGEEHRASKTVEHIPHHKFAIDFGMPVGTALVAARGGTVIRVDEAFANDTGEAGEENRVEIQHEDGTVARYIHLDQDGVVVDVGDEVDQGQLIGFSGNSGFSTGPHTHFDVSICPSRGPLDLCSVSLPVNFANAAPRDCELMTDEYYRAQ